MKPMKRFTHGMMALTLIMSISPNAFSRIEAVTGVATPVISQSPGAYEFKQYDESALQSQVLNILEQRSKDDKAYVESAVRQLNGSVSDLVREHLSGGLLKMSDDSTGGGEPVQVLTFLAAKRSFEASIELINAQINAISQLPSVMKANATLSIQGRVQEVQNRFNVDLSPVIKAYEGQVSAIVGKVNGLSFRVKAKNGALVDQRGLVLNAQLKDNQYTADELNNLRMQAARLRVMGTQEQNILNQFDIFALKTLNTAIDSYGKSYRMNLDESGKVSGIKAIEQIFFARSLMRAQYGVALGAPQLNYDLKSFNWDFVGSDNHLAFTGTMVTRANELIDLHNKMATALVTQEARAKEIFGDNKNLISRVTSAITFLKGERSRAGLNVIMLKMLVADLEEEIKVGQPGGRRELKTIFRARYYSNKENEAYFKELGKNLNGGGTDAWSDSTGINADTLVGQWNMAKIPLANFQARLNQAQAIEDSLKELEAGSNKNLGTINSDLLD